MIPETPTRAGPLIGRPAIYLDKAIAIMSASHVRLPPTRRRAHDCLVVGRYVAAGSGANKGNDVPSLDPKEANPAVNCKADRAKQTVSNF